MKVTVVICSYNKTQYVGDAIESVFAQTHHDIDLMVLENSTDGATKFRVRSYGQTGPIRIFDVVPPDREQVYAESWVKNKYLEKALGEVILCLADDDVLMPGCLAAHVADFERHQLHAVNYHRVRCHYTAQDVVTGHPWHILFQGKRSDPPTYPGCRIDGGAIMFKKDALGGLQKPWFPLGWDQAATSDADFMNRLVELVDFHPLGPEFLSTKRVTPISTHQKDGA